MQMQKRTRYFIFFGTFFLSLSVLGGYFCFFIFGEIQQRRESIDLLLAQKEIAIEKTEQFNDSARQYEFIREREETLREIFVRKDDLILVIERLETLAKSSGVEVQLDILESAVKKKNVKTVTSNENAKDASTEQDKKDQAEMEKNQIVFLMEIRGTYEKTMNYLDYVERMQPIASFESITLKKEDQKKEKDISPVGASVDGQEGELEIREAVVLTTASFSFMQMEEDKK